MNTNRETDANRLLELEVDLDADVQSVWNNLTNAELLSNWFPEYAAGGAELGQIVSFGWGEHSWESSVSVFDEHEHLQWTSTEGFPLVVDFYLQEHDGGTRLRLVQSGFGQGDDWDEMYDALDAGWSYFLQHLAAYLKYHPGISRSMHWARHQLKGSRESLWSALINAENGLFQNEPVVGNRMVPTSTALDLLATEWEIIVHKPGRTLGLLIPALNHALMLIELESGSADMSFAIWLSTYDLDASTNNGAQNEVKALADTLAGLI